MNERVIKPILIGIFVLVILVTAVVFAFSASPQASEITPPSSSASSDAALEDDYLPAQPGFTECNDGEDNDYDGLTDWADDVDESTIDPECVSTRDRSEQYPGQQ